MRFATRLKANNTCNVKELKIDKACLDVINKNNRTLYFYGQTAECYMCDGIPLDELLPNSNTSFVVDTKFPFEIYYKNNATDITEYCYTTFSFVERGHYGWNITEHNCSNIYITHEPPKPYMPILAAFVLFFFLSATWALGTFVARSGMMSRFLRREMPDVQSDLGRLQENEPATRQPERVTKSSTRAKFLDTFRGIAVLLMIFVNNEGGKYWFFNHSPWNGLTLADLVLPFFAWVMGFTIVISMRTQLRISVSRSRIISRCLRRSLTLIFLGLIVNSTVGGTLRDLRFAGILQLLGVTYFICATIEAIFTKAQRTFQYGRFGFLQDILDGWTQWLIVIAFTTTHLLLTFLLPVPDCPTGYLGPGGLHLHNKYANCTAGAAGYIDRTVLGSHIYAKKENGIYGSHPPYDPEGIMSIMSAVLLVYMGVQAGRTMLTFHQGSSRVIRWLIWSLVTGIVSGILCNFTKEEGVIPVNKSMMSLSYVLATSSIAFFVNAVLYVVIDIQHWWRGNPFLYAGTNAILLYVGHYFTKGVFPWAWEIEGIKTHANELTMSLWTTILWAIIAYILYKKDIILTI